MRINVLLQPNLPEGYTATVLGWPDLIIKRKTKDEAITAVRQAVKKKLSKSEIVTLDIDYESGDPWMKFVGMWEDDPTFDDFLEEISAYRRQVDEDDSR